MRRSGSHHVAVVAGRNAYNVIQRILRHGDEATTKRSYRKTLPKTARVKR